MDDIDRIIQAQVTAECNKASDLGGHMSPDQRTKLTWQLTNELRDDKSDAFLSGTRDAVLGRHNKDQAGHLTYNPYVTNTWPWHEYNAGYDWVSDRLTKLEESLTE